MRILSLIASLFFAQVIIAQNTVRYSQLNFAQGVNNPSAIAIDGSIMCDFIFRNQWFGVEGAPTSFAFNGQYEFNQNMAGGLVASYDRIGVNQSSTIHLQYAYRLHFDYSRSLAMGLGIGIDNTVSFLAGSSLNQVDDPVFSQSYGRTYLNGNFGIFYNSPSFYIGGAIPKLFQATHVGTEPGFQPPRWHYYLSSGFYINAGENFVFNPHLQIKGAINTPLQGDAILRNTFFNRFSIVVGYRSENSIIAGFDILFAGRARVGYSFNYDVGPLARTKGASNELYLGLAFPYHSDRADFGARRFLNNKGKSRHDLKVNSKRRYYRRGRTFGRKDRYR